MKAPLLYTFLTGLLSFFFVVQCSESKPPIVQKTVGPVIPSPQPRLAANVFAASSGKGPGASYFRAKLFGEALDIPPQLSYKASTLLKDGPIRGFTLGLHSKDFEYDYSML